MPIYEYACTNCSYTLDALQKMSDDALVDCPECGQPDLKRLISAPRFRLKGSGWYETDFKKDKQRNVVKSDTETAKSDKSDGKSDGGKKSEGGKSSGDGQAAPAAKKSSSSSDTD